MFANDESIDTEYSYYTPYEVFISEMKVLNLEYDVKKRKEYMEKMDSSGMPYGIDLDELVLLDVLDVIPEFNQFRDSLGVYDHGGKYRLCYWDKDIWLRDFLEFDYRTREVTYLSFTLSLAAMNKEFYVLLRKLNTCKIDIEHAELIFTDIDISLMRDMEIGCLSIKLGNLSVERITQISPNISNKIKCDMIMLYDNDLSTITLKSTQAVLSYFDPLIIETITAPPVYHGMKICYLYEELVLENVKNEVFIHQWPISLGGSLPENGDDYNIILFKYISNGGMRECIFTNIATGEEMDYNSLVDMMRFMRYSTKSAKRVLYQ